MELRTIKKQLEEMEEKYDNIKEEYKHAQISIKDLKEEVAMYKK